MSIKTLKSYIITTIIIIIGIILFSSSTYITKENEYSVIKQFGEINKITSNAGLNFKVPFIQSVKKIDKRKHIYDLPKSEAITADKKTMIVDAYVLWQVVDPKIFTQSLNASNRTAEGRIDIMVYNAIKTTISSMSQEELITSRDVNIDVLNANAKLDDIEINDLSNENVNNNVEVISMSNKLLTLVKEQCDQYGIIIKDIKIKRLDLPDENKEAVYQRMITERNNIAAAYTAQGQAEAQKIRNTTDKEVNIMLSKAQANADSTIADGEAEYMQILSDAYNNPDKAEFYTFSLSLDSTKESLTNNKDNVLFLSKDSPLAQVFVGNY